MLFHLFFLGTYKWELPKYQKLNKLFLLDTLILVRM